METRRKEKNDEREIKTVRKNKTQKREKVRNEGN